MAVERADVLIVGAGPSGSTLAYTLASQGLDVVVLEKHTMPRVKPCGGGCDPNFLQNLPAGMDVSDVTEDRVSRALVRYQGTHQHSYPVPCGGIAMTQRSRLDHRLATQAAEAGARLYQGEALASLVRKDGTWTASTSRRQVQAAVLVGADGAYSTVARLANLPRRRTVFIASEWDVYAPARVVEEWKGQLLIDCSVRPMGYGWVFPKEAHLNIGFGVPPRFARDVHRLTAAFALREGLAQYPYRRMSHWLPFSTPGSPVVKDGAVLVGDAAGLADPATGAGLSWGVLSSRLAAPHIARAVATCDTTVLEGYQASVGDLMEELQAGMALRNVLFVGFALMHREVPSMFRWVINCLSGITTYTQWRQKHRWLYQLGMLVQKTLVERQLA